MPAAGSEGEEGPAGEQAGGGTPKLCGYLQKLSGKGPLRGFRSRWFVFDPRRCYLYYFKGPQEALPLGRIDIASACFSYHQPEAGAAAGDEGAAFEVHGPNGAVAVLKCSSEGKENATGEHDPAWLSGFCGNVCVEKRFPWKSGCNSSGYDILASGTSTEEVGIL